MAIFNGEFVVGVSSWFEGTCSIEVVWQVIIFSDIFVYTSFQQQQSCVWLSIWILSVKLGTISVQIIHIFRDPIRLGIFKIVDPIWSDIKPYWWRGPTIVLSLSGRPRVDARLRFLKRSLIKLFLIQNAWWDVRPNCVAFNDTRSSLSTLYLFH